MKSGTVLITGANGFVGRAVCAGLLGHGWPVRAAVRQVGQAPQGMQAVTVGDLRSDTDWTAAVQGVQALVHTAARVHVMQDSAADPLAAFRAVNVEGTLNLARQAAAAGVKRFVFISSVKVNGESTQPGQPFSADDAPAPLDAYGISKMEAEQGLHAIAAATDMQVVIIRPPLVYGPGVKANFATLMRAVQRGWPLPLGAIHNLRSLVGLDNLVDLIMTCLTHPAAAGQTFLVSDGEDVSTTDLLRRMGVAMGKPARLIPVPAQVLTLAATLLGKSALAQRVCGSLQLDIAKTRQVLGWCPPVSLDEGLRRAALQAKTS